MCMISSTTCKMTCIVHITRRLIFAMCVLNHGTCNEKIGAGISHCNNKNYHLYTRMLFKGSHIIQLVTSSRFNSKFLSWPVHLQFSNIHTYMYNKTTNDMNPYTHTHKHLMNQNVSILLLAKMVKLWPTDDLSQEKLNLF